MYLYSFPKQKKLVVFLFFIARDKSIAHLHAVVPHSVVENILGSVAAHHHVFTASVHNVVHPFANVLVPLDKMHIVFGVI